jgi:thiamine biosynthesis lipoprotein
MPKMFSESVAVVQRITLHGPTMGTRWSAKLDADDSLDIHALQHDLAAVVNQVDRQMSPWKPDSDLMRVNRAPVDVWVAVPAELLEVLACALEVQLQSAGAFDPCVGGLVNAWGFGAACDAPDANAIRIARQSKLLGAHACLELDSIAGKVRKLVPLQLDLCGIAKGYAVDLMVRVLQKHGVRHALAALDGELRAVGGQSGGLPWSVALESPELERRAARGVIELEDLAVATSGDYRHFMEVDGARLAHTMDPRRWAPVNNGVASVTVLARTCMQADAWATALLVAGPGEGLAMAQHMGMDVLFLLRRDAGLIELGMGRFGQAANLKA